MTNIQQIAVRSCIDRTRLSYGDDGTPKSNRIRGASQLFDVCDQAIYAGLQRIHNFVDRILERPYPAFRLSVSQGLASIQRTILTVGPGTFPDIDWVPDTFLQHFEPSEQIRAYLEAADELGLRDEWPLRLPSEPCRAHPGKLVYEWANEFVELVRQKCGSKASRTRQARKRFASTENFRKGERLIEAEFQSCSRLNVVRIDFGYLREHRPTLEQAKKDFRRFANNFRQNSTFDTVLGYIWHLEWARETGYHWHVAFFLDGSETRADGYVAHQIGIYWNEVITSKCGRCHNCNADKSKYKRLGIGMIWHGDMEKRGVLIDVVLRYLTKADEYARPKLPPGTRTFGTSQLPRPHSGLGRKRALLTEPGASQLPSR